MISRKKQGTLKPGSGVRPAPVPVSRSTSMADSGAHVPRSMWTSRALELFAGVADGRSVPASAELAAVYDGARVVA